MMRGVSLPPPMTRERIALYAGTIVAYADMYLTQAVLPVLSREFGVGAARAGVTVSAVVLTIAAASPAYGPLADALGRRRVMATATAFLAAATLACAFARSFGALVALRAVQGLFVPGVSAVSVAYAGDRFHVRELPSVVAGIISASILGGLLGRVLSGAIAAHLGWRASFAAFAALTAAAAVLVARGLERAAAGERRGLAAAWAGMLGHLRDPPLVGAYLVGASLFFAWMGIFTFLPFRLAAPPYGLSTGAISSVYLVFAVGALVSPVAGRLSARIPPRRLVAAGLAVEAIGIVLLLARPLPLVLAALAVLVAGAMTAQAIAPAFVNVTARTAKGGANALYLTAYYVGGTLGAIAPGVALQAVGWKGVVATCAAGAAVALLANALLCGRAPRAVAAGASAAPPL
jgi:MFS transporter, YNFM family, putative membrane transport protein